MMGMDQLQEESSNQILCLEEFRKSESSESMTSLTSVLSGITLDTGFNDTYNDGALNTYDDSICGLLNLSTSLRYSSTLLSSKTMEEEEEDNISNLPPTPPVRMHSSPSKKNKNLYLHSSSSLMKDKNMFMLKQDWDDLDSSFKFKPPNDYASPEPAKQPIRPSPTPTPGGREEANVDLDSSFKFKPNASPEPARKPIRQTPSQELQQGKVGNDDLDSSFKFKPPNDISPLPALRKPTRRLSGGSRRVCRRSNMEQQQKYDSVGASGTSSSTTIKPPQRRGRKSRHYDT